MANKAKGFVISAEMKRPSGASYWIVRGMRNGEQIKPQFDSYAAAQAEYAKLNAEFHGVKPAESLLSTRLNPDDLDRAELVMKQLQAEFPGVGLDKMCGFPSDPVKEVLLRCRAGITMRSRKYFSQARRSTKVEGE